MKKIFGSLCLFGGFCISGGAYAQSLGYFETTPYYNNTTIIVNSPSEQAKEPAQQPKIIEKSQVKSPYLVAPSVEITTHSDVKPKNTPLKKSPEKKSPEKKAVAKPISSTHKLVDKKPANKKYHGTSANESDVPSRVILFCGTPAEPINKTTYPAAVASQATPNIVEDWHVPDVNGQKPIHDSVSIPANAKSKIAGGENIDVAKHKTTNFKQDWDELNRRPQTREEFATRGPIKAIYQDTKSAIANDVPQALADHLPWVDTNRKQENFESVLDRVSDNLQRASAADPEWAYPAQSEIRELAQKLDKLPSPPQYRDETVYKDYDPKHEDITTSTGYHKRPVWGGANASSAEQPQKPVALKNNN